MKCGPMPQVKDVGEISEVLVAGGTAVVVWIHTYLGRQFDWFCANDWRNQLERRANELTILHGYRAI